MKTIAQQINWDFEENGRLELRNKNGELIYFEDSSGNWEKWEYDSKGNQIYFENSYGFWEKKEYDSQCNQIYFEDSEGFWAKHEYDFEGNKIYIENSNGKIIDNRPKTCEDKVIEIDGQKYKLTKL